MAAVVAAIVRTAFDNMKNGSAATGISVFSPAEKQRINDLCVHDPELAPADAGMLLGLLIGGLRRVLETVVVAILFHTAPPSFLARVIAKLIVDWLFRYLKPLTVTADRLQNFGLAFLAFDGRVEDYPGLPTKLRAWGETTTVAQIQNMLGVSPRADQEWIETSTKPAIPPHPKHNRNHATNKRKKIIDQALSKVLQRKPPTHLDRPHIEKPRPTEIRHGNVDRTAPPTPTIKPTTAHAQPPSKEAPAPSEEAVPPFEPEVHTATDPPAPEAATPPQPPKQTYDQEPDFEQDSDLPDWRIIIPLDIESSVDPQQISLDWRRQPSADDRIDGPALEL